MDDVVFTDGEADIGLFPIGSADRRHQNELAANDGLVGLGIGRLHGEPVSSAPVPHAHLQGARVLATYTLHWEVDPPRRLVSVRKVTYWPHILLLKAHIAVTPFGSYLVRFPPD
jgi:hypothetical protein